jgi:two-component system NtrC family sensor kinase
VLCYPGDLNQVFLNLFVNAAHAIGEAVAQSHGLGQITVTTRREGDDVVISVADTGGGIPEEIRGHIFEPFFTTKAVGQGSGQGLALARTIVVEKHSGAITIDTTVGKGTTFHVRLPIGRAVAGTESAA